MDSKYAETYVLRSTSLFYAVLLLHPFHQNSLQRVSCNPMKSSLAATNHRLCRHRWIYNQDHDQCQDV